MKLMRWSQRAKYGGGNDEREQTLNQLLVEMDGFESTKELLIAATNRLCFRSSTFKAWAF